MWYQDVMNGRCIKNKLNLSVSIGTPLFLKLLYMWTMKDRHIFCTSSFTPFEVLVSMIVLQGAQVLHQSSAENPNRTILLLDSRNQESAQIPGFRNPMVKWCNWDFL